MQSRALSVTAALLLCGSVNLAAAGFERSTVAVRNGPEIVLEARRGTGVVCIAAAFAAGSSGETVDTRGASHLIEHMLFDGSDRFTREELTEWVDGSGAFLNAFTRKEATVFFMLVPSSRFEQGLDVLARMVLHPVFPPAELEKERKVVREEMQREFDDPASRRERIVDAVLYRGSELTEPIIGNPAAVDAVSRDEIIRHYRTFYAASAARIIVMGDFDPARAKEWIVESFCDGGASCGQLPAAKGGGSKGQPSRALRSSVPVWTNGLVVRREGEVEAGLDILVPVPGPDSNEFPAVALLARMLGSAGSPLGELLEPLSIPAPDVGLEVHRDFSALRFSFGPSDSLASHASDIAPILAELAQWKPAEAAVAEARTEYLSAESLDREMYHLFVMSRGEELALFGARCLWEVSEAAARLGAEDCARAARSAFQSFRWNGVLILPDGAGIPAPPRPQRAARTLLNGCTLVAIERPGSDVAAVHILFRGRSCLEGTANAGMSAILAAALESSSAGRELESRCGRLGVRLGWGDNPYVTHDDYLLNPSFFFVRIEGPDGAVHKAVPLVVAHLSDALITAGDLDGVRRSLAREVAMRASSLPTALRTAVFEELLGEHPYGRPIFPAPAALASVTLEDLERLRKAVFHGGNTIVSMVSASPPAASLEFLESAFGAVPAGAVPPCPALPAPSGGGARDRSVRAGGAYIARAWLVAGISPAEQASLLVAAEMLSRRMQSVIREKEGLAYSVDCGVTLLPGGAVVAANLGTRGINREKAEHSLGAEIDRLAKEPPDADETRAAVSRLLGRRMRSSLASINEAYQAAFDALLGGGAVPPPGMNDLIAGVTAAEAAAAASSFLAPERSVLVRLLPAGDGAEGAPSGGMPPRMGR